MKLNKDQARILAGALASAKYRICNHSNKEMNTLMIKALNSLEEDLEAFGKDERRVGRASANSLADCLERYALKTHKSQNHGT